MKTLDINWNLFLGLLSFIPTIVDIEIRIGLTPTNTKKNKYRGKPKFQKLFA